MRDIELLVASSSKKLFLLLCCFSTVDHLFPNIASLPAAHTSHCGVGSSDFMKSAIADAMPDFKKKASFFFLFAANVDL